MGCSVYSQDRINPTPDLIIGEFKSWVNGDNVSGWDFDNGEVWKERKGYLRIGSDVAYIDIDEKYNSKLDEPRSRTSQNFNEIGVIQVEYKGEKYNGLGIEEVGGSYRYPTIKEDWETYIYYRILLFKSEDLLKLDNLEDSMDLRVFIRSNCDRFEIDKKYESCYASLKSHLESERLGNNAHVIKLKKTKSGDKEVIRFLLPQYMSKYSKLIDFENHYFEVPINEFNNLLSLLKT